MPIIDDDFILGLKKQLKNKSDPEKHKANDREVLDAEQAFKRIIRLVSIKDRALCDIRKRLLEESFPEDAIEESIARACNCGLVDDRRFAESLVRSRLASGKGRRGIEAELARLDIEASQVPGWSEDHQAEDEEVDRAIALLRRKPPSAKNKRDAAYRKLIGKGYSSSIASTAVRLWYENLD